MGLLPEKWLLLQIMTLPELDLPQWAFSSSLEQEVAGLVNGEDELLFILQISDQRSLPQDALPNTPQTLIALYTCPSDNNTICNQTINSTMQRWKFAPLLGRALLEEGEGALHLLYWPLNPQHSAQNSAHYRKAINIP